jgi:hypothetical protein
MSRYHPMVLCLFHALTPALLSGSIDKGLLQNSRFVAASAFLLKITSTIS